MLVKELQDIANDKLNDKDTVVRRDGQIVRIDVYPEKGNTMLYYCCGFGGVTAYLFGMLPRATERFIFAMFGYTRPHYVNVLPHSFYVRSRIACVFACAAALSYCRAP